jgi:hypothetical protein
MKPLILSALLILLLAGSLDCEGFKPDPVYEHARIYGAGIDMTGVWNDGKSNLQLRKKNFKPKGR